MDRLTFVNDICAILTNPRPVWRSLSWHRAGMPPTADLENGFTDTIFSSKLLTWRRHYTTNHLPPSPLTKPHALLTIDEWAPGIWPLKKDSIGWIPFGTSSHHGIAFLEEGKEITSNWSTHAKRHLKTFAKAGCDVRFGTYEEVTANMLRSQVPRAMSLALAKIVEYRLAITPETLDILVATNNNGGLIGCFVAGNDEASKESMYIMGYFLPEAAKLQPMTGLVHAWFSLLRERGYVAANFGLMLGPHANHWDPWWGLSNFKTHFGITRVHLPPGYWKFTLSSLRETKKHP